MFALATYFGDEPFSTRDVEYAIREHADGDVIEALPVDLADVIGKAGVSFTRKLGKAFAKRKDTPYGDDDLRITQAGEDSRNRSVRWRVLAGLRVSRVCFQAQATSEKCDAKHAQSKSYRAGAETNPANPETRKTGSGVE